MKKRSTYIQITSDRLVLATSDLSGELCHASAQIMLSNDPAQWTSDLAQTSGLLRELVEQMSVLGSAAKVFYVSPTQRVSLESIGIRSRGQAVEAAKLSCMEKINYSRASAVCCALPLGRDRAGESPRRHIAVAVERDDVLAAIFRYVEDAGLRCISASPIAVPLMSQMVGLSLADREPQSRLYLGESHSLFYISGNHSLIFARRIELGIQTMVSALTRPIHVRSGDEPLTLSKAQARDILFTIGIPDHETIVHYEPRILGRQIIPALQPVLQRVVVELKQSLRFSLSDEVVRNIPIHFLGPGSRIPNLPRLMAEESGASLSDHANPSLQNSAGIDDSVAMLADVLEDHRILQRFTMLPNDRRRAARQKQMQSWLWAGTAAAIAMAGIDAMRYHIAIDSLSSQRAVMLSHQSEAETFQQTSATLSDALHEMFRIERLVDEELRHYVDSRALMDEIAELTPGSIRLSSMTFRRSAEGMAGTLHGLALHDTNRQTELKQFVNSIRSSPLFDDALLGSVQASSDQGVSGEQFEASLVVRAIPRPESHVSVPFMPLIVPPDMPRPDRRPMANEAIEIGGGS